MIVNDYQYNLSIFFLLYKNVHIIIINNFLYYILKSIQL